MATAAAATARNVKDAIFEWEGKDKNGKLVRGEMRAGGEAVVNASLRRQGILVSKVKKRRTSGGRSIKQKDIAIFTRQLATMMKAGVPLLQAFDIVARGSTNPRMTRLLNDIRNDVETGTSLSRPSASTRCTSTRCTATWSKPARPAASWRRCSTGWRSTRKRRSPSSRRSSRR
jgi:type IV pilus assembly protein PilC